MKQPTWTHARVERLITLWDNRVPALDISEELGIGASAVLGKVYRLGLTRRKGRGKIISRSVSPIVSELRAIRERKGITQRDISTQMRRHYDAISEWENGKHDPHLRNLENWCFSLGVKLVIVPVASPEPDACNKDA